MYSSQCPNCGLIGWATDVCKRCGQPFAPASQTGYAGQNSTYAPHAYGMGAPFKQRTGLAIASMVIAIISFFTFLLLIGIPGAIVALVLGIVALCQIKRDPAQYGGRGFAIAGIAISSVALFFLIPIVAAIAIPNLLASRRAANESSAIKSLRTISSAEQTYQATAGAGRSYGSLAQLSSEGIIDSALGEGEKSGYRFQVAVAEGHFTATAVPADSSSGGQTFFIADDGLIHVAKWHGRAADQDDPIMTN
jgi:type II secretory pathway pseudopilin PulG